MAAFGKFFLPGPTEVRPAILRAMRQPMIGHRGPEFEELFARLQIGLKYVFRTTRPVFVSTSSATGLMEAGVRCAPAGAMLALVNGAFSQRFVEIARRTGRECDAYEVPLGQVHDPAEVARRLDARRYSVVTVVHCETSTGALNDVRELGKVVHEREVTLVVDSVSGIGGAPFSFDAWEVDFALTGSQKALALPPGLAFAAATPAFVAGARAAGNRGLYFDILEFEEAAARNQTPSTPALSLLYALDAQLTDVRTEGLENRWMRHAAMLRCAQDWADNVCEKRGLSLSLPVPAGSRSPTVTTLRLPEGVSGSALVSAMSQRGYTIAPGYRAMGEAYVRIGHMGDHTVETVSRCLRQLESALVAMVD